MASPRSRDSGSATRFETEGVLRHHRTAKPCRCCRGIPGDGHIYAFGVDLGRVTAGASGPRPEHPSEWLSHILYPLRGHDGARVRIIVEVEHDV